MKKGNGSIASFASSKQESFPEATDRAAAVFGREFLAANDICETYGDEISAEVVAKVARGAQGFLVGEVAAMPGDPRLPAVACHEGCAWCCSALPVSAWPLEVFAIAAWLQDHLSPGQLGAAQGRLREAVEERGRERTAPGQAARVPCPLLEGTRCSVYPVRPASCVGWTSVDAAPCEAYARGDDAAKCQVDAMRMFSARAVPLAAATVLMNRGGPSFDQNGGGPGGFVDLSRGLLAVLEQGPEEAMAKWLAGELFAGRGSGAVSP